MRHLCFLRIPCHTARNTPSVTRWRDSSPSGGALKNGGTENPSPTCINLSLCEKFMLYYMLSGVKILRYFHDVRIPRQCCTQHSFHRKRSPSPSGGGLRKGGTENPSPTGINLSLCGNLVLNTPITPYLFTLHYYLLPAFHARPLLV